MGNWKQGIIKQLGNFQSLTNKPWFEVLNFFNNLKN